MLLVKLMFEGYNNNIDSTEDNEKYINLQASFSVIITELPSWKKSPH